MFFLLLATDANIASAQCVTAFHQFFPEALALLNR